MLRRTLVVATALMLSGCSANWHSIYRAYNIDPNAGTKSVLMDAKQRAILSMPNPAHDASQMDQNTQERQNDRATRAAFVCAEPSPDALSAISAAFSGGFALTRKARELKLSLANTVRETAKQLGKRNATIQLLRDGLYRQCEAYMNGLIGRFAYENIANKYINAMVVLLAIEEITPESTVIAADIGEKPDRNGPTSAEANVSDAEGSGGGDGKQELPKADPAEQLVEDGTDGSEAPDDPNPSEAEKKPAGVTVVASSGTPVVGTQVQGGIGEVSEEVVKQVSKMAQAFLQRDTVNYCLATLLSYPVSESFATLCETIVLNEYQRQDSNNEPSELTEAELRNIIN